MAVIGMLARAPTMQAQAGEMAVMSFNARPINGPDGRNRRAMRRELLADTIAWHAPDLSGTQELSRQQGGDTVARLPQYRGFGRDRRGRHDDEHMGIFYRNGRLRLLRPGDFWLSDTPGRTGGISWGNLHPCMVSWGLFERRSDHRQFYLLDTHLPCREQDERARSLCTRRIAQWIGKLPATAPVILTGDFNTGPVSTMRGWTRPDSKDPARPSTASAASRAPVPTGFSTAVPAARWHAR